MADFVRLTCLGLPEADDLGIFLTGRKHSGERFEPLPDCAAGLRAIVAELIDVARRFRGSRRPHGVEQADVLTHHQWTNQRAVLTRPASGLGELTAQSRSLVA